MFKNIKGRFPAAGFLAVAGLLISPLAVAVGGGDLRTFHPDGTMDEGDVQDSYRADLVMYVAGNQFMVMEDLVNAFLEKNPDIESVYVATLPPGKLLKEHILSQGRVLGEKTSKHPDLFASVNLGHLQKLESKSRMDAFQTYIHNKLTLMVKEGNPQDIQGVKDLTRDDLVKYFPNPETEGIFIFYGSQMLKDAGIYDEVVGKECRGCWSIPGETYFTKVHHRETPNGIEAGEVDAGIVWNSEVAYAKKQGRPIDGVDIPSPLNQAPRVGYAMGMLKDARNQYNAMRFMAFLGTDKAQGIYEAYGFKKATDEELKLKPIPTD
ncbi:molybdate ABC transporter substrate-binding protein [Thiohalorhabdus sp.]|uniref:molybdate ABC transporter substrate-binding protein n=1 Tax=Thiohalorhabdus sp. TaxID=3094134 RepID=UPI002FC31135